MIYTFGDYELDLQLCELRRAGEPRHVEPQVFDALGRLCREPNGTGALRPLEACAPTWLAQMPSIAAPEQLEAAQRRSFGATREGMLREMVEALEGLTRETPLVLLLEDLHWSDPSTLDLLVWLVQRREPARLLVLGTFRPSGGDAQLRAAVAQALRSGRCSEIPLRRWSEPDLRECCEQRHPGRALPDELLRLVHRRRVEPRLQACSQAAETGLLSRQCSVALALQSRRLVRGHSTDRRWKQV